MRVSYLCNFRDSRSMNSARAFGQGRTTSGLPHHRFRHVCSQIKSRATTKYMIWFIRPPNFYSNGLVNGRRVTTSQDGTPWARSSAEMEGVDFSAFCFGEAQFVLQSILSSSGLSSMRAGWSRPFQGGLEDRRMGTCDLQI